jgi:xylulokinase
VTGRCQTPTERYVLAVDLGTSGAKVALVSSEGRIVSTARAGVDTLYLPGGGVEQDPESVWQAVKSASAEAVKRSGVNATDVLALICTSQYSSIVPVDASGRATMNMVLWLDKRGAKERLRKLPAYPRRTDTALEQWRWLHTHGLPPVAGGMSLTHMRYIKFAQPEVYERTAKFLEPMDYLNLRFCGRAAANQCTAFMSLLTDNRRLNVTGYDLGLVRQSLIDAAKLPELVPLDSIVGTVLPEVAAELGLSPSTKVITPLNDTQAGGMGTAAFSGDHAAISVGTTSVMITHVPFKRTDIKHSILSMPSPVPGTYFVMAENGIGGAALEYFLEKVIFAKDDFGELTTENRYQVLAEAVARASPGSDGLLFLPWMGGAIAPHAEPCMRGGFLNVTANTTRSHMARAVLEGVAMNLRWLKGPVEAFAKRQFSHFVFYGGGAESDVWSQIMADVLGAPVHQMQNPRYATCVGIALLAFQRLGFLSFEDFQRRVPIRAIYTPKKANKAVYEEMSGLLAQSFTATRPIFRALNRAGPGR